MQEVPDKIKELLSCLSKGKEGILEENIILKLEYASTKGIKYIDRLPAYDIYRQCRLIQYINTTILKDNAKIDAVFGKKKSSDG